MLDEEYVGGHQYKHKMTEAHIAKFHSLYEATGPDKCWVWQGAYTSYGHPRMTLSLDGRGSSHQYGAQRLAYDLAFGIPAKGRVAFCKENVGCVNPAHLTYVPVGTPPQIEELTAQEEARIEQFRADLNAWMSHHYRVRQRRFLANMRKQNAKELQGISGQ